MNGAGMNANNLFADLANATDGEEFMTLFESAHAKIERIVSNGHATPPGVWYDQEQDEWVTVLRGTATLEFANGQRVQLKEGDCLTIPRHVKHRVAQTSAETIWLAVHVR